MSRIRHIFRSLPPFLALCLLLGRTAAAQDVTFDVQPRLLNLGETAQAALTFHGVRSAPHVEFPSIPGLQITGTGQQTQFGTGGSRVTLTYRLFPQRPGTHVVGPYTLSHNGRDFQIPEIRLEVRSPDGQTGQGEMIFARMKLPERAPYVHQTFEIALNLYSLPSIELAREINLVGGLPETGLLVGGFEEIQMGREEIDGQVYNVRRIRARARALTAGTFALQPVLRAAIVDRNAPQRRRDTFFDGFFDDPFNRPSATPVQATVPPAALSIRPIPEDGRPKDFGGAVGQYEFAVDVRPRELEVGQPITVTLRLQGIGNVAAARPPAYRDAEDYRAYEARLVGDVPDPHADRGHKTFEQVIIPRTDRLSELPALSFSFFDPEASQFRTIGAGPFRLEVRPSTNGASALMLQVPGGTGNVGTSLVLGHDLVYVKSAPARWKSAPSAARVRAMVALHAAAPLALAGLFFSVRRRNRLETDVALARRQRAPRAARANLRKAEAAIRRGAPPAEVFSPLVAAAFGYFGHRLNLPPGAIDAALVLDKLRAAGADENDVARWRDFFELSDRIRYAPESPVEPAELSQWLSTASDLLRKAERSKL